MAPGRVSRTGLTALLLVFASSVSAQDADPGSGKKQFRLFGVSNTLYENNQTWENYLDTVNTIDSSGLGELIRCRVTSKSHEAEVKLLNVNIKARKLLTMAQLVGVFEMFDDEELAVASFSA